MMVCGDRCHAICPLVWDCSTRYSKRRVQCQFQTMNEWMNCVCVCDWFDMGQCAKTIHWQVCVCVWSLAKCNSRAYSIVLDISTSNNGWVNEWMNDSSCVCTHVCCFNGNATNCMIICAGMKESSWMRTKLKLICCQQQHCNSKRPF